MSRLRLLTLACTAALVLLAPGTTRAENPTLHAVVGPGFNISLTTPDGAAVKHLDAGTYTVVVDDKSDSHNFHLTGPGVDERTSVENVETVTWTITVTDGTYTFVCDAHPSMRGTFTAGAVTAPPPVPKVPKLVGTVGPGFSITLKTSSGAAVKKLKARTYAITVRDRSQLHDFHLTGPGVNRKTSVGFVGTTTWKVALKRGTYRYVCDPHRTKMRGSFKVS